MRHDQMVAAYDEQRARFAGPVTDAWAGLAPAFKMDPHRPLDPLLTKIASYLHSEDTLIDVGGGAGRLSLPLAARCREVIVVDPSAGMREVFEQLTGDAGITNARFVESGWLEAGEIDGDVALVAHVTYFVPTIVPFIDKLSSATRRRVIFGARSVPPPNQIAGVFRLAHNEDLAPVPGHQELLRVLEELGISAETIDIGPAAPATREPATTREDAVRSEVDAAIKGNWLREEDSDRLGWLIGEHFDELFADTERGYWRRSAIDARDLLITWETRGLMAGRRKHEA